LNSWKKEGKGSRAKCFKELEQLINLVPELKYNRGFQQIEVKEKLGDFELDQQNIFMIDDSTTF
jgi:hypothetical protein